MHRQGFSKAVATHALVAAGGLAAPRRFPAADAKMPRFVPQPEFADLHPARTTPHVVCNAPAQCFDALYGRGSNLAPKQRMCMLAVR
jgi:hypothetical protein